MRVAITGATSGIGAASAALLKQRGAEIVGFDIAEPRENVDQWVPVNMADPSSIAAAVDQAEGSFDALLNIAGLPPRDGMAQTILQVNYFGLVAFTDALLGQINEGGAIVNLASRAGWQWRENIEQVKGLMALDGWNDDQLQDFIEAQSVDPTRSYNLSKEAVIVWTIGQTERMIGMKLRMNSVSPSAVATGILDDFVRAFGDRATQSIARAGRAGTAEEVAALVTFLAQPESNWIKGNDILIDGGMSAMVTADALQQND
ncbi:MAG: coniferyl-alcohol dehydrogenase [Rhizobiaceae bacterium]